MSQQSTKPSGTIKKTKTPLPLSPLLAKAKSRKPLIIYSQSPTDPTCPPSFCITSITSPTPSLRWRSKPSIKNCYHDNSAHAGPSCATNMLDTSAVDAISSHQYDRLRESLHSTVLPAIVPKGAQAYKKPHKHMMASKSVPVKSAAKQTAAPSAQKGSTQNIPTHNKRRYWVPTPTEMANIGDKIPKAFVKTSLTGRKTVAIPTDTRTWLRGNLTPIESSSSVTENQMHLVRGGKLLNKKPKKNAHKSPPPPPPPTAATDKFSSKSTAKSLPKSPSRSPTKLPTKASSNSPQKASHSTAKASSNVHSKSSSKPTPKSPSKSPPKSQSKASKNSPPVTAVKKPAKSTKSAKNDPPPKTAALPKTKKTKDMSSRTSGETTKTHRRRERYPKPLKLDTVYINTPSLSELHRAVSGSTHSLPPPFTPTEEANPKPTKIMPATVSIGFSAFVECFYCRVRYPINDLRAHQDECCKEQMRKRALERRSPLDLVQERFENSFHKLNFDGSSCSLLDYDSKPAFIEEGGLLSALPSKVSSNEALNQTCWYCGWDYGPEIFERHVADCAAVRGNVRPTAEGRKLRRLVERKIKAYGRYNPRRKNLWV